MRGADGSGEEKGGVPHRSTLGRYAVRTGRGRASVCGDSVDVRQCGTPIIETDE